MADLFLNRTQFGDPKNTGNLMPIEAAHELLNQWVENDRLRLHCKQVAALMKGWAMEKEGAGEQEALKWELAGLLHDADWEKYPDLHCKVIIEELENRNIDPAVIRCIASHGPRYFGVEPETAMDKMINAFDELSGLIHAYSLMRPGGYEGMDVAGVKKRLKEKAFAASVNRDDITDAVARLTISLEELIAFILPIQKNVQ